MAIVGRLLEAQGFRVGIIAQPDWRCDARLRGARPTEPLLRHHRRQHGFDGQPLHGRPADPPRRCVHAAAAWAASGRIARVIVYAQRAREAFARCADRDRRHRGQPAPHRALRLLVREGAPLDAARRARPTCWCTATPSAQIVEIAHRLAAGETIDAITDVRGTAFVARRRLRGWIEIDSTHARYARLRSTRTRIPTRWKRNRRSSAHVHAEPGVNVVRFMRRVPERPIARAASFACPRYEQVASDPVLYAHASRILHLESNPGNARALVQRHGDARCVAQSAADPARRRRRWMAIYELPYARAPHPAYGTTRTSLRTR